MEYQQIGAWWHGPVVSTDALLPFEEVRVFRNAAGAGCWVVFGTLLGPEATGPGGDSRVCLFLVSWLHRSCMFVCVGCVVRGCCLRTT